MQLQVKILLSIAFCIYFSLAVRSQDTLFYTNGTKQLVEMMLISGDSMQYLKDGEVQRVSVNGLIKISYLNGNVDNFEPTKLAAKVPKASLLAGYPDLPIEIQERKFYLNRQVLTSNELESMWRLQTSLAFQKQFKRYETLKSAKTLLIGMALIGATVPLSYLVLDKERAISNVSSGVNSTSRYVFGGVWAASVIFSIALHNASQEKRMELAKLYNQTYYP